ncbi:MAG TPA: lytic murein transglycosylase, partial [Microvirga sp.]|nr:lytic murein transglycosylase [Microvirga sp.]
MPRSIVATGRALFGAVLIGFGAVAAAAPVPAQAQPAAQEDFGRFVEGLWPEARARGVSRATFDEAFRGVTPDPKIIALTKKQSEFVQP